MNILFFFYSENESFKGNSESSRADNNTNRGQISEAILLKANGPNSPRYISR